MVGSVSSQIIEACAGVAYLFLPRPDSLSTTFGGPKEFTDCKLLQVNIKLCLIKEITVFKLTICIVFQKETVAKKKSPAKEKKPPPRCKAILLCDHTILEAGTGKTSLIGIFDRFFVPGFPGVVRPYTVYLQLVDGIGQYALTVEVHDVAQNSVIARMGPVTIEFQSRYVKVNGMVAVPPMLLPHSGNYDIVVFADGQVIEHQTFQADSPPSKQPEGDAHAADEDEE